MQIYGIIEKEHRTALVIDQAKYDSIGSYQERINRLLESLNGHNIKTDIYTLRDGALHFGKPTTVADVEPVSINGAAESLKDGLGYDLVLVSA